jgi:hypothetical protein
LVVVSPPGPGPEREKREMALDREGPWTGHEDSFGGSEVVSLVEAAAVAEVVASGFLSMGGWRKKEVKPDMEG